MCICVEDRRDEERRWLRAVLISMIASAAAGAGVALVQWSDQGHLVRFVPPSLLFSGQVAVATFWSALLVLYFLLVRRTPSRVEADRRVRRAQDLLDARLTLARRHRRRR